MSNQWMIERVRRYSIVTKAAWSELIDVKGADEALTKRLVHPRLYCGEGSNYKDDKIREVENQYKVKHNVPWRVSLMTSESGSWSRQLKTLRKVVLRILDSCS